MPRPDRRPPPALTLVLGPPGLEQRLPTTPLPSSIDRDGAAPLAKLGAKLEDAIGIKGVSALPVALRGLRVGASRGAIVRHLSDFKGARAAAILNGLADAGAPLLVHAETISRLPAFWAAIAAGDGGDVGTLFVHRDPLAMADEVIAARGSVRRFLFDWHVTTLEILAAFPESRILLDPAPAPTGWASDVISPAARDLLALIDRWDDVPPAARGAMLLDQRDRLDEAVDTTGVARRVALPPPSLPKRGKPKRKTEGPAPAIMAPKPATAPLILHYHLFKNAGTSVDAMLKANFGTRWFDHEFGVGSLGEKEQALRSVLESRPDAVAFSSHTALLPVPEIRGRTILPVIFVRHPLLRLRSAYSFERKQDAETPGAVLAKQVGFAGYVEALLGDMPGRQAKNFQTSRFAFGIPGRPATEFARAQATLRALPFVGLVEKYDRSIERLTPLVRALFPDFKPLIVHSNADASALTQSPEEKLARLREEIGAPLYARLVEANRHDLALYEEVAASYAD